jgi:phosphatidylserine synthase
MAEESRQDRELIELLNELRVTLPGVQVLFAFLLIVPFSQQFDRVNDLQKYAYLVALVATAIGSALLIAPTPYHRIRFRDRDKEAMLRISNRLAIAGTACLATGMTSAVFFVSDYLFKAPVPFIVAGAFAVVALTFWYAVPIARDLSDHS